MAGEAEPARPDTDEQRPDRMMHEPPGRLLHALVALVGLAWLVSDSVPGSDLTMGMAGMAGFMVAVAAWLLRGLTFGAAWRAGQSAGRARRFLVLPLVLIAVVGLAAAEVPLRVRWELSRPAFERALADRAAGQDVEGEQWIGLFRITSVSVVGGEVTFEEATGDGWIDPAGFTYLPPEADPSRLRYTGARPLGGGWWAWAWS